ncbi:MAG: plasmid pRiA4b ORF-3 family protein, partial [Actinomycetota bacterium]|nr:plasmid pRiA4b ORF-3 family protein [Actinomycetota bacterium]
AHGSEIWGGRDTALYLCDFDLAEAEPDDPPGTPLRRVRVGTLLSEVGAELQYLYDYGDHWQLTLIRTGRRDGPAAQAAITGGHGAPPPEDIGGIHAWNDERPADTDQVVPAQLIATRQLRRRRQSWP